MNDSTRPSHTGGSLPGYLRPAGLVLAMLAVIVVWVLGVLPWWIAVPLLMVIAAASLAGLAGVFRRDEP